MENIDERRCRLSIVQTAARFADVSSKGVGGCTSARLGTIEEESLFRVGDTLAASVEGAVGATSRWLWHSRGPAKIGRGPKHSATLIFLVFVNY